MSIALVDSGVGGLSIWRVVCTMLPEADLLYLADQAHLPYGSRSLDEIYRYMTAITRYLHDQGVRVMVLACNTASAAALHPLREAYPEMVFVGMEPAVKPAAELTRTGAVGVLATEATFQGRLFASVVERFADGVEVHAVACPGLAEQIEAGVPDATALERELHGWIDPLHKYGVDRLVLGCTHYPLIVDAIRRVAGDGVDVIDPSDAVARQVVRMAQEHGCATGRGTRRMMTTGVAGGLAAGVKRWCGDACMPVELRWHEEVLTPRIGEADE